MCLTNTMKRTKEPFAPANPDHVLREIAGGGVVAGRFAGRGAPVPPELDHHRPADRRERLEVLPPLRPAREEAVHEQHARPAPGVRLEVKPRFHATKS